MTWKPDYPTLPSLNGAGDEVDPLACKVCGDGFGARDPAIGASCPVCGVMRPVHRICQADPCLGCVSPSDPRQMGLF